MFPTRTTSTTGTLRVPAATAAAATSFGWATTTPTLSLRVAAPEPTGEAERRPDPSAAPATVPAPAAAPATVPAPAAAPPGPAARCGTPVAVAPVPPVAAAVAEARPADEAEPSAGPAAALAPPAAVREAVPAGQASPPATVRALHAVREGEPGTVSPSAPLGTYRPPRAAEAPLAGSAPCSVPAPAPVPVRQPSPRATAGTEYVPASGPADVPAPQSAQQSAPEFAPQPAASGPADVPAPQSSQQSAPEERDTGTMAAPTGGVGGPAALSPRAAAEDVSVPARRRTAEHVPGSGPAVVSAPDAVPAGQAPTPPTGPGSGPAPLAGRGAQDAPAHGAATVPAPQSAPVERDSGPLTAPAAVPPPDGGQASLPATAAAEDEPAGPASRREDGSAPQSTTAARGAGAGSVPASAEAVVPAAREAVEPGPGSGGADRQCDGPGAANSGVPGPGVAEIVARAVARAMDEDDTQGLPNVAAPRRGSAVTEVPLHLPFRAASTVPLPERARAAAPHPARPAPGRRVPRGDDRLREHRGPVLPGWVGVAVGGLALAGCTAVLWRAGILPAPLVAAFGAAPRAYQGLRAVHWPPLAFLGIVALIALGGLGRARTGHAWVLTLFGRYRGTVRRTGLTWVSPLLLRRRVDVRLRHWRSDPMPAVDSGGLALQVVVQVVWQVKDTARATLAVADHTEYLAEQVESAMARVLSQLPADAFHEDAPTLRDAEAVGDALTRMLAAETEAVGIEVFSAQPTRIEYAAEVAEAMRRRRVAAIDAKHRDAVLTSVVDAVDDTVHRLTSRGLVELDDYERKALVKDLTVAFYTGRTE
ncbi:SPFH domain-containing protein [Streptomyces yangpuensis]|uniref:SPFH domain-containing protein n=1 Tax=Streptomyces yangpuensis TaxID=1648182 RepID=UPI00363832D4